jgi:uncharacterized protein (DUF1330 family)
MPARPRRRTGLYGGHIALRGPIVGVIEGDLAVEPDTRLVVLEFGSLEDARAWWESDEYRPAAELRRPRVADSRAFLVDGIDLGPGRPPEDRTTPPRR